MNYESEESFETYNGVSVYRDTKMTSEARGQASAPRHGPPSASFK